jgi:hypothetical protein
MSYPVMVCKWVRDMRGNSPELVYQKIELPIPPQTGMHIELRCVGQVIQFINMQRKENGEFMAVCWLEDDTRETDVRYRVDCYRDTGWKVVSENEDAWD